MGGRLPSESVAGLRRNHWPLCVGLRTKGAALAIVPLVLDADRPAKANLSLDAGLLAAIDEAAAARNYALGLLGERCAQKIESEG